MSDGKLNVPISINGDLSKGKPSTLLEGELYVDKDGNLYYGNISGTPLKVNSGKADNSENAKVSITSTGIGMDTNGKDLNHPIYIHIKDFDSNGYSNSNVRIGNVILEERKKGIWDLISNGDKSPEKVPVSDATILDRFNLKNIRGMHLTEELYGNKLPTNAVKGQVFFKISS